MTETYFAVSAPGVEAFTRQELISLGLIRDTTPLTPGGIGFSGDLDALYRANLWLRTPNRILARLGEFSAVSFAELRKKAGRLNWAQYLRPSAPITLHVTCHKSRLYHSGAVAERVAAAIADALGRESPIITADESQAGARAQLIIVRIANDVCTISIDSSGELLHRRGYRVETAKAPLRETLAAALLLASGWDATSPLIDPFCGSGTIAIEAACLALSIAPGLNRKFAFTRWPGFESERWSEMYRAAQAHAIPENAPIIMASDRDAGAMRITQANAERAGVESILRLSTQAVSAMTPPPQPGWIVTNPPYGVRVSGKGDLRNLYAQFGNVLRAQCADWHIAVLCSDPVLLGHTGLKLDTSVSFVNGGIPVRLGRGIVSA